MHLHTTSNFKVNRVPFENVHSPIVCVVGVCACVFTSVCVCVFGVYVYSYALLVCLCLHVHVQNKMLHGRLSHMAEQMGAVQGAGERLRAEREEQRERLADLQARLREKETEVRGRRVHAQLWWSSNSGSRANTGSVDLGEEWCWGNVHQGTRGGGLVEAVCWTLGLGKAAHLLYIEQSVCIG